MMDHFWRSEKELFYEAFLSMTLDIYLEDYHTIFFKIIIDKLITTELENWICICAEYLKTDKQFILTLVRFTQIGR